MIKRKNTMRLDPETETETETETEPETETETETGVEVFAKHGGRSKNGPPTRAEIQREAARLAASAAGLAGWRCPEGLPPAAREAADYALQRIRDVSEGRVSFRLAPSTLKAAVTLREEICGPIPQAINLKASMTLEALVATAARKIEQDAGAPTLLLEK